MEGKRRRSPTSMRSIMNRPLILAGVVTTIVAIVALVGAACGGGSAAPAPAPTTTPTLATSAATPQIALTVVSGDLALGPNRFILGIIDQAQNSQVLGAQIHLRFFKLDGTEGSLKAEADAMPIQLTRTYTHTHADGTVESHEAGEAGVYVAAVEFDSAGTWAVEATGEVDGQPIAPPAFTFSVRERSIAPALGSPAPRSVQAILSDVSDITEIDTSDPPNPAMHDMTIADAVTSGKPSVIVFSTSAFCLSQICGPVKQVVDDLYETHKAEANFVHVEPYFIDLASQGKGLCAIPTLNLQAALEQWGGPDCPTFAEGEIPPDDWLHVEKSWNLPSEPWVFVIDGDGDVAAKFETFVSFDELDTALFSVLTGTDS